MKNRKSHCCCDCFIGNVTVFGTRYLVKDVIAVHVLPMHKSKVKSHDAPPQRHISDATLRNDRHDQEIISKEVVLVSRIKTIFVTS